MILNYINWNPNPEIIKIGSISIRYYGLLFVGGLVLCIYVMKWIFKQEKIPLKYLDKLSTYGLIGIFVGARLGHCFFYEPAYFLAHPLEIILPGRFLPGGGFKFTGFQGLASHGGTLGLILALILYSKKTKQTILNTVDLIAIVAALGATFIRLANLMNSEIIGMPTNKPWAFIFKRIDNIPRHPAQLYEAISYLVIFIIMFLLYKATRSKLKNGFFFGLVIALIFAARFFIEFIKEHQVDFEEGMLLNMGQILSIPYVIVGIGFMIYGIIKTKKDKLQSQNT